MPLDRSFVFPSFPQNAYFLRIHFRYAGPVPHSHYVHPRYSGPASHSPHMNSRDSGPTPKFHSGPVRMLAGPVRMPPRFRDRPHIPTRTTTGTGGIIPSDLRHLCKVEYPTIRFNSSRAAAGLVLDDEGRTVTQTVGTAGHKFVYATESFSTGCHYSSFRIKHRAVNSNIMFGVSNGQSSVTASVFPGCKSDASGCSLDLANGHFCRAGTRLVTPAHKHLTQATKIGVLLDLYHRTVSFYADGNLVGTGAGSDVLTANMYYPVIAICELDHSVTIEDIETK